MSNSNSNFRNGRQLLISLIVAIIVGVLWGWLTTIKALDEWWRYFTFGLLISEIYHYGYWIPKLKAEGKLIIKK
ncbi:MAG TPA: hypothetical protein VNL73_01630 [Verrucomicrobiae bacterium]|nr:hypothetical protein [Verrucomicrobiae bacterium]